MVLADHDGAASRIGVALSRGGIEARVERESLLGFQLVPPGSASRAEEQVPAFLSDRTGNDDERVAFQQRAAEGLLPLVRRSWSQPSRVGHVLRPHDVYVRHIEETCPRQDVGNGVK